MLWWKAWRETRERFLLILLFIAFGVVFFYFQAFRSPSQTNALYLYRYFYDDRVLLLFFALVPPLLASGGLLQEQRQGTAAISLALPVKRSRLLGIRGAVNALEFVALCLVPAVVIPVLSFAVGTSYPLSSELHFGLLWIICGSPLLAMSFLFSSVLAGDYTALTASIVAILVYYYVTTYTPSLFRLSMAPIVVGTSPLVSGIPPNGLPGPYPWLDLFVIALIAAGLFGAAILIARRQDF
ncbi:MAG TPA: hypothetical protein VIY69_16390 [Candidatus Acidoferrales bacterium]